jgi:hypothetical protein
MPHEWDKSSEIKENEFILKPRYQRLWSSLVRAALAQP